MIKNLSPSRASQFKACPKQFKFTNVDKISEPTTAAQAKGTTVHKALEELFNLPQSERTTERLHNIFRNTWTKVRKNDNYYKLFKSVEEERDWGVDGLKLLSNYMKIEDPKLFNPLEKEKWVKASFDDLDLRGVLDRMDRNSNGEIVIIDYKSGESPEDEKKLPRFFALKLYALLIKNEFDETPSELKIIYLKNSTIHSIKIDDEELEKVKVEILKIWQNIKVAFKENNFPAIENTLCDWCYYKPICPVFNKNAPDTDELKILNEEIKELNDNLEVLSMFDNPNDLPKDSPLSTINIEEIKQNIETLRNKKDLIEEELQELLRK